MRSCARSAPRPTCPSTSPRPRLRHGDVVVLCSDGVWSTVGDDEIAHVVAAGREPRTACETLLKLANERGGRDNATAVVGRFEAASRRHDEKSSAS